MLRWKEIEALAEKIDRCPNTVFKYLRGTAKVSVKSAIKLEKATGISRNSWLYPDEFVNPMIEKLPKKEEEK